MVACCTCSCVSWTDEQVKAKLEDGKYDRVEDVARDIRLIWSNCILYNSPGSEFGRLATGLAKKFEERFSKVRS